MNLFQRIRALPEWIKETLQVAVGVGSLMALGWHAKYETQIRCAQYLARNYSALVAQQEQTLGMTLAEKPKVACELPPEKQSLWVPGFLEVLTKYHGMFDPDANIVYIPPRFGLSIPPNGAHILAPFVPQNIRSIEDITLHELGHAHIRQLRKEQGIPKRETYAELRIEEGIAEYMRRKTLGKEQELSRFRGVPEVAGYELVKPTIDREGKEGMVRLLTDPDYFSR